ncbi:hypothetical protein GGER_40430 [Serratia rubidaea]
MLALRQVHHIAIIASDYAASKHFYCDILGFTLQGSITARSVTPGRATWR